jgi:hypothetical protein
MRWVIVSILSLIYIVSPLDFVPEALLGPLGFTDDALVIAGWLFVTVRMIKAWRRSRALRASAAQSAAAGGPTPGVDSTKPSGEPASGARGGTSAPIDTTARVIR